MIQQIDIQKSKNTDTKQISIEKSGVKKKINKIAGGNVNSVCEAINSSEIEVNYSSKHFSVLFKGAKLLSANRILNIIERGTYIIFNYKKVWHTKIWEMLLSLHNEAKNNQNLEKLPLFTKNVEVTLYHSAPVMVDRDALAIMFKYIIDAFKKDETHPYGILIDDNPAVIVNIKLLSEKGEDYVGIKFVNKNSQKIVNMKSVILNK